MAVTVASAEGGPRAPDGIIAVTVHPVFVDADTRGAYEATVPVDGPLPVADLLDRLQRDHPVRVTDSKGTLLAGRGVVVDGWLQTELDVVVSPATAVDIDLVPSFVGG